MRKYLITGAKGQLAQRFIRDLKENGKEFLALSKEELNITNFHQCYEVFKSFKPDVVINCAAYNLVDIAEADGVEDAYMVNFLGVYNLSLLARDFGTMLVHFSTDYVFDGIKEGLYVEQDAPSPLNNYGRSKLFGEKAIKSTADRYLIFRTSWVYGEGTQNFLYKLSQWAQKNEYLRIACDEFSVPTYTKSIVEITLKALDEGLTGLYHLTNSGYASRYEWAKEFFELKGIKKFIYPAYREEFNLPAKRPKWSAMSNEKISKALNIEIKRWKEALREFIKS